MPKFILGFVKTSKNYSYPATLLIRNLSIFAKGADLAFVAVSIPPGITITMKALPLPHPSFGSFKRPLRS